MDLVIRQHCRSNRLFPWRRTPSIYIFFYAYDTRCIIVRYQRVYIKEFICNRNLFLEASLEKNMLTAVPCLRFLRPGMCLTTLLVSLSTILLMCRNVSAKQTKCIGPTSHDVGIEIGKEVHFVDIVGFKGYQIRNKPHLKVKKKSFYDCYKECAEMSQGNPLVNLGAKNECGSFQFDSKKKTCYLYNALSYANDEVPQVKICKSTAKDKKRYTAATMAYKFTGSCWLPNMPSDYCYGM